MNLQPLFHDLNREKIPETKSMDTTIRRSTYASAEISNLQCRYAPCMRTCKWCQTPQLSRPVSQWVHSHSHMKFGSAHYRNGRIEAKLRNSNGKDELIYEYSRASLKELKFPWYLHSVYQDRSVNSPRYPMDFTNLMWMEDEKFELERRVKKPFNSHLWLTDKSKKINDPVRKYFALSIIDRNEEDQRDENVCSLCGFLFPFCPSFVQTALSICFHALWKHNDQKEICKAALEDVKAIQEATGCVGYLEKAPKYKILYTIDFLPDILFVQDVLRDFVSERPYYCIFCFHRNLNKEKLSAYKRFREYANHLERCHNVEIQLTNPLVCLDEVRVGREVPLSYQTDYLPLLMVRSADGQRYSWCCSLCEHVIRSTDPIRLIFLMLQHTFTSTPTCTFVGFRYIKDNSTYERLSENFNAFVQQIANTKRVSMLEQNTVVSLSKNEVLRYVVEISVDQLANWFCPMRNAGRGVVRGRCPNGGINVFEEIKRKRVCYLYVCPHCLCYFLNPATIFLHFRPGQCKAPSAVSFMLNQDEVQLLEMSNSLSQLMPADPELPLHTEELDEQMDTSVYESSTESSTDSST
ncbi:hypothetical protein M3Y98_00871300 [Aphelenchoides besseyi]|nr:hypothetical protein M3Y98_00871300 [Aphelenchoides besseyi]KAI6211289.1 hypothetical protein M3Y96_00417700 [Aphelenchoides besseyi]